MKANATRIPELDGLRGVAILLILIGHHFGATIQAPPHSVFSMIVPGLALSWTGVDLFFVLSGFLIGGILLDHREAKNYYQLFYLRRVCRIFPLYYLNLLLFAGLSGAGAEGISAWLFEHPLPWWSYVTFTQNILSVYWVAYVAYPAFYLGVTWSVAVEEQFYMLIPLVIRRLPLRWLPYLLISLIILVIPLRLGIAHQYFVGTIANYILMPTRADGLLIGVLAAFLLRQESFTRFIKAHHYYLHTIMALVAGSLIGLNFFHLPAVLSTGYFMSTYGYTLVDFCFAGLLISVLTNQNGWINRRLRSRWLQQLGLISYGLYLIHLPVLGLAHGIAFRQTPRIANGTELVVTLIALIISMLIAAVSWEILEQPILKWGRSFYYQ